MILKSEEMTDEAIDYIFSNADTDKMSTWEQSFFESVNDQWVKRRTLTDKQKFVLGNIWDKQD